MAAIRYVSHGQGRAHSQHRPAVSGTCILAMTRHAPAAGSSRAARLRAALAPATADRATLIVAQRVATIRGADEILVLEHGRIVGRGTHEELLAGNATYQEIVDSQLSAEEARA